jgi:hypothetical protein
VKPLSIHLSTLARVRTMQDFRELLGMLAVGVLAVLMLALGPVQLGM